MGQVGTEQTLQDIKGITKDIRTLTNILARGITTEEWPGFKQLVKDGLAQSMYPVGSQLVDKWYKTAETSYDAPWDIVHYDAAGNAYLKWHYGIPTVQFDAPEAIYYFDGTEQAGVEYYILIKSAYGTGWVANKGIAFTLSEAPAEGDQLVISTATNNATDPTNGIAWNVYGAGSTVSKQNGITSEGTTGTKLGETSSFGTGYTNGRVNAPQRVVYGYNRYAQSAIRQWLNSQAAANAWWTMQNPWDRPPSQLSTLRGFLAGCSAEFIDNIDATDIVIAINTVEGAQTDRETVHDKIFLPSLQEMYITPQLADAEGVDWDYFKALAAEAGLTGKFQQGSTYPILKTYDIANHASAVTASLRSANRGNAGYRWIVTTSGGVNYYGTALNSYSGCPACKILKSA